MRSDVWDIFDDHFSDAVIHKIDLYGSFENIGDKKPNLSIWAQQIIQYIEINNLDNVVIIGHSMGGYIAMEMLKIPRSKIIGLIMMNTHVFGDTDVKKKERLKTIRFIDKYGKDVFIENFFPYLFVDKCVHKHVINRVIHSSKSISKEAIIWSINAMRNRLETAQYLKKLTNGACFISGEKDTLLSQDIIINSALSTHNSVINIFENTGHFAMYEAKEKSIHVIIEYLSQLPYAK